MQVEPTFFFSRTHKVSLYAHFAPRSILKSSASGLSSQSESHLHDPNQPLISAALLEKSHPLDEESDFLKFLKFSNYAPLEVVSFFLVDLSWFLKALRECDRQNPPLYREKIYILAKMGNTKEGLAILLREIGDVTLAIDYVQVFLPKSIIVILSSDTILIYGKILLIMLWLIMISWFCMISPSFTSVGWITWFDWSLRQIQSRDTDQEGLTAIYISTWCHV